ncbi:MAG TPA: hypothetical protein ENK41_00695 [Rhodobacteraceae bacterium]|nr:hypothetical protein [Paracoccaceae bacterium]
MATDPTEFWKQLSRARAAFLQGDTDASRAAFQQGQRALATGDAMLDRQRQLVLERSQQHFAGSGEASPDRTACLPAGPGPTVGETGGLSGNLAGNLIGAPSVATGKQQVFIDAQHGLGNRLRAIAAAASIAGKTDRELVIVWHPDAHCDCRFDDLFQYDGPVVSEPFIDTARALGYRVYNYMEVEEGAEKDAPIDASGTASLYIRSAYPLNAPEAVTAVEDRFLRRLDPVAEIRDMIASVRTPNDLSVHVRMQGGLAHEALPYEAPENWTPEGRAQIDYWRGKSHYSNFFRRIDQLTDGAGIDRLFVAADSQATYDAFLDRYGDRVAWLRRDVYDRSARQLKYALADIYLLGHTRRMLGSSWSSFSDIARRLSPNKLATELSGKDF